MILFQVDAVPAADVTWWREGVQIENKDEFHIGEDNYDNYDTEDNYNNEENYMMKMLRMVMTMMRKGDDDYVNPIRMMRMMRKLLFFLQNEHKATSSPHDLLILLQIPQTLLDHPLGVGFLPGCAMNIASCKPTLRGSQFSPTIIRMMTLIISRRGQLVTGGVASVIAWLVGRV